MSTGKSYTGHHHALVKSATIVGFATFCSRILGFIRDIVIARLFGVYVYAQAFVVAFKIPNLFRDLLGEGASNAAFVPVFSEYLVKHDKEEFWELVNVVLNILLVILTAVVLLGVLFAPIIVRLIAPGFCVDSEKLQTTILLTQILFPYVLLICLAAYATSILNSLKHFSVPAFAPCLLNISIIVFALVFGEGIKGLSSGVLVGGALQLLIQIPVLYAKGFRLKDFLSNFRHPAAKIIGKLMLPRLFSSCIYQLNNFVDSIFGSFILIVGDGGVAGLYFAYRLIQFPLGIFSNSLAQAILPTFSTLVLEDTSEKLKHSLSFGLRATFFVMLPASLAFMALANPIITLLFGGGKFDSYAIGLTSKVLFYFSIGLCAYGINKIVQSCFFAMKDTLTPAKISFLALLMNIAFNLALIFPMKLSGIALATSLSGIIATTVLFMMLKKRLAPFDLKPIISSFIKILIASILMAIACRFAYLNLHFKQTGALFKFLNILFLISGGVVSYIIFCYILKVKEMHQVIQLVLKKIIKKNGNSFPWLKS